MSARRTGFYSGSFDPLTFGHLDVLTSAVRLCDRLVVAIGVHPGKAPLLSQAARAQMIREVASDIAAAAGCELEVASFDDLSVAAARRHGAGIMIRGLRDGTDLDYEMQLAGMNAAMAPDVHTIFIPATGRSRHITSTLVRQIALMGGDIAAFVPSSIARALVELTERRRQPAVPD